MGVRRRKCLVLDSMRNLNSLLTSHKLLLKTKIRMFNVYCGSVFLYNSELWVLDKTLNNKIDSFEIYCFMLLTEIVRQANKKSIEIYYFVKQYHLH